MEKRIEVRYHSDAMLERVDNGNLISLYHLGDFTILIPDDPSACSGQDAPSEREKQQGGLSQVEMTLRHCAQIQSLQERIAALEKDLAQERTLRQYDINYPLYDNCAAYEPIDNNEQGEGDG